MHRRDSGAQRGRRERLRLLGAVANALPALKDKVDVRLAQCDGEGVVELAMHLCNDDRTLVAASRKRCGR